MSILKRTAKFKIGKYLFSNKGTHVEQKGPRINVLGIQSSTSSVGSDETSQLFLGFNQSYQCLAESFSFSKRTHEIIHLYLTAEIYGRVFHTLAAKSLRLPVDNFLLWVATAHVPITLFKMMIYQIQNKLMYKRHICNLTRLLIHSQWRLMMNWFTSVILKFVHVKCQGYLFALIPTSLIEIDWCIQSS